MEISGVQTSVNVKDAKRVAILRNVSDLNNNKFYHMFDMGSQLICEYGRIGSHASKKVYSVNEWESIYKKKTNGSRGKEGTYTDVTDTALSTTAAPVSVKTSKGVVDVNNSLPPKIQAVMNELMGYSKKSVQTNYTVSVEAVNELQVIKAQELIDEISGTLKIGKSVEEVNNGLVKLYQIIPRRMNNVKNHLISDENSSKLNSSSLSRAEKMLGDEQATLDVMRQQVSQFKQTQQAATKDDTKVKKDEKTILDLLGITMRETTSKEDDMIKDLLGSNKNQFRKAFKVDHTKTSPRFKKFLDSKGNKNTKLFWHGSRNENWLSILETGLVLRPANAVITGKMFGYGLYYADKAQKSIGYTSLRGSYWASGGDNKAYLALFNVHTGKEFHVLGKASKHKHHESWMYELTEKKLQSHGDYDCLFAEGGADLRNNEYIVYNENQCTVEYIVEIS